MLVAIMTNFMDTKQCYHINASRVSENAFGIIVNRFRVLAKYIHLERTKCTVVTNACIALHNFLLLKKDACYATAADNDQPQQMSRNLAHQGGNRNQGTARDIRDELCDYFCHYAK